METFHGENAATKLLSGETSFSLLGHVVSVTQFSLTWSFAYERSRPWPDVRVSRSRSKTFAPFACGFNGFPADSISAINWIAGGVVS